MHHSFIPTVYENFKPVFLLNWNRQKSRNWHTRLIWEIEWIKAVLSLSYMLYLSIKLLSRAMKQLLEKFCFEFPHGLNFNLHLK